MASREPRSTEIHCGSCPSALAQRVVAKPSTAFGGVNVAVSFDDDVAGLFRDRRISPLPATTVTVTAAVSTFPAASRAVAVMVSSPSAVSVTGEVTVTPSIVNPLDITPMLSVAVIDNDTGVPANTLAPSAGAVIDTRGAV